MKLGMDHMKNKLKNISIKNPIALIGSFIAALSFLFPWWQIYFPNENGGIYVYPYTVDVAAVVPEFTVEQTTIRLIAFTSILLIAILITIYGAIKSGWKGRALVGFGGLMELGIAYGFRNAIYDRVVEVAEHGVGMFPVPVDLPAQGETTIHGAEVITSFDLGLDLIRLAAIVTLISILLHNKLIATS